jgi:hypothetical protein
MPCKVKVTPEALKQLQQVPPLLAPLATRTLNALVHEADDPNNPRALGGRLLQKFDSFGLKKHMVTVLFTLHESREPVAEVLQITHHELCGPH